jgi:hypothetical protein
MLPFPEIAARSSGACGGLVGKISGLTSYESGVPYSVLNGQDADGLGGNSFDRPNNNPLG